MNLPESNRSTPLYQEHLALKAKMGPFSGWDMPIWYAGIISEHEACRTKAVVFDTGHMGIITVSGRGAAAALDRLVTAKVAALPVGRAKYGFLLDQAGGILDDLIWFKRGEDDLLVVTNAGTAEDDLNRLRSKLPVEVQVNSQAGLLTKLDVQGPAAGPVLREIFGLDVSTLKYFTFVETSVKNVAVMLSATGYTGGPGFELIFPQEEATSFWRQLLAHPLVSPAGLGARDTLRLEAGLPLYGMDIDKSKTPVEAARMKFVELHKDFVGKEAVLSRLAAGPAQLLIFFVTDGRRAVRHGHSILDLSRKEAGVVTSAAFIPGLNKVVGMGYVGPALALPGTDVIIKTERWEVKALVAAPGGNKK
ncbi:MAG: glycine cleavage system aminomethyltransferase GcvT [Deltaproteobacteria bacterium]|nr:glycine cleavage system aminomethyltransferase GcvT [Deltaproteobacteria bacterium]